MAKSRKGLALLALAMTGVLIIPTSAFADATPSGQVALGGTTIEPAYNDANGAMVFLSTPNGTQQGNQVTLTSKNNAPIYLPVYPVGSTEGAVLNCTHIPVDNCPDHGPLIAGFAKFAMPTVYGAGVLGHDHLVGIASTGGDFNIIWVPTVLLFTPKGVADGTSNKHMITLKEVNAALDNQDAIAITLTAAAFKCASVSMAAYDRGTAVTPAPPLP